MTGRVGRTQAAILRRGVVDGVCLPGGRWLWRLDGADVTTAVERLIARRAVTVSYCRGGRVSANLTDAGRRLAASIEAAEPGR